MITNKQIQNINRDIELGKISSISLPELHCDILSQMLYTKFKYNSFAEESALCRVYLGSPYYQRRNDLKDLVRKKVKCLPKSWTTLRSAVKQLVKLNLIVIDDDYMKINDDPKILDLTIYKSNVSGHEESKYICYDITKEIWTYRLSVKIRPTKMGISPYFLYMVLTSDSDQIKLSKGYSRDPSFVTPEFIKQEHNIHL